MSFSDTANAKKYAAIAEVAAAQAKLSADKLELAPDYAAQAAASAEASALSAQAAVSAVGVVENLAISASESATSAAASAASAGNAAAAAIGRSVKVPDGELLPDLPAAVDRQNSLIYFDETSSVTVKPITDFAVLDENGKIPVSVIPSIALTEPFVVDSEAEMLSLDAQVGDIAKRTDLGYSFCLAASPASTLSNWIQLTDDVLAQLGQSTGAASVGATGDNGTPTTVQLALQEKANKSTLSAQTGATTIGAVNSAGTATTVQGAIGEKVDATVISATTAPTAIGTAHRGTLALDLNAIDRRPDGYGDSIAAVLSNGPDAQINATVSITGPITLDSNQRIQGVGGNITQITSTAAGVRIEGADPNNTKNYVTIGELRTTGSTLSTEPGNEGYALFLRNTKYNRISGVLADKYTGGVVAGTSKSLILRDVITHNTTFHPLNPSTRDGRGGYGVITDNIRDSIIDGIIHDVGAVDDGRHVLYVSTGGYGNTDGNSNFIANNLIGKYKDKDDRNFMGVNIRKSYDFIINNTVLQEANSGIAFNVENGDISDFVANNSVLDIIKYQDGVGVYGITMPKGSSFVGTRGLISNFNIRVRPKTNALTGADCVAVSTGYQNSMITNGVTSVPVAGNPILINDGANGTTISNIHDVQLPGYSGATAAMITFTGAAISNITVRGVSTNRPMFARLFVVTDLTVDFTRKARISVSGGVVTKLDSHEILESITLSSVGMTITMPTHVTQNAIENAIVNCVGPYQAVITNFNSKTLTINTYTISGAVLNPITTPVVINVILSS